MNEQLFIINDISSPNLLNLIMEIRRSNDFIQSDPFEKDFKGIPKGKISILTGRSKLVNLFPNYESFSLANCNPLQMILNLKVNDEIIVIL